MNPPGSGPTSRAPAPPLQRPVAKHPRPPGRPQNYEPGAPGSAGPTAGTASRPPPRPSAGRPLQARPMGQAPRSGGAAMPRPPAGPQTRMVRPPPGIQREYQRIRSPGPGTPTGLERTPTNTPPPHRSNSAASMPQMNMYQSTAAAWDDDPNAPYNAGMSAHSPYALNDPYATNEQPADAAGTAWDSFASATGFGGTGTMMNDATTQMGMQFGRHVAAVGGEYVQRNFRALLPMPILKHYFKVSNSYVLHKLRIILFPWRHKPWSRRLRYSTPYGVSGYMSPSQGTSTLNAGMSTPDRPLSADGRRASSTEPVTFCVPREDVNSPDMYIPLMALVTYVIATSIIYGLRGRFHPEVLGYTASRALAIVLIEFSAIKLGCYLLNIQGDHTVFDLLAYSGYKFVGTLVVLAVGVMGMGRWVYWLTFLYMFAANAFFLVCPIRTNISFALYATWFSLILPPRLA
ncbi:Protein transport protein Yif1 [Malassezia pachydermatis]